MSQRSFSDARAARTGARFVVVLQLLDARDSYNSSCHEKSKHHSVLVTELFSTQFGYNLVHGTVSRNESGLVEAARNVYEALAGVALRNDEFVDFFEFEDGHWLVVAQLTMQEWLDRHFISYSDDAFTGGDFVTMSRRNDGIVLVDGAPLDVSLFAPSLIGEFAKMHGALDIMASRSALVPGYFAETAITTTQSIVTVHA